LDFPKLSNEQRNSLERATEKYHVAFKGSPAEEFLEARGIPASVADGFRLGYVEDPETEHEQAKGRLAIPYETATGVVALRFRWLPGARNERAKYWQPEGSALHLYNVRVLHGDAMEASIAICEGELDAIVLSGLCDIASVGVAGTGGWLRHFRHLFSDYARVPILMDAWKWKGKELLPDEDGRKAAKRIRADLDNGVVVELEGGDVNEVYLDKGADFIRKAVGVE